MLLVIPLGGGLHDFNTLLDIKEPSLGHILKTKVIGNQCILLHCLQNSFSLFLPSPTLLFVCFNFTLLSEYH